MNRIRAGDFRGADNGRHTQVAIAAPRRTDANILVGEADMQRILVCFGVDRDRLDPQLAARADHAKGNLSAVGDQDFLEHESWLSPVRCLLSGDLESARLYRKQPLAVLYW